MEEKVNGKEEKKRKDKIRKNLNESSRDEYVFKMYGEFF